MKINTLDKETVRKLARDLQLDSDSAIFARKGTTEVSEKDLPAMLEVTYERAPESLEQAIERLIKAEMLLEDLSRAIEIAAITRSIDMLDSFKRSADEYLENKILITQPDFGAPKITVVTND